MKKFTALVLLAALILSLAGCAAPAAEETTVRLQTEDNTDSITVSGRVGMEVVPDVAQISIGVNSHAATPAAAREDNAEVINNTLDALAELGIEEKDIQTSNMDMRSVYNWYDGVRTLTGYEMDTTLTIIVRDMDKAGEVVDAAIAAGSNELNGVEYLVSNRDEVYDLALTDAVGIARKKAEGLAAASGRTLGMVLSIEETSNAVATVYDYETAKVNPDSGGADIYDDAYRTSIRPGNTTVEAQVRVVYQLVDGE